MTKKRAITDTEILTWFLSGGRVWKSKSNGWYSRIKGDPVDADKFYGITSKEAAISAIIAEMSRKR